MKINKNKMFIPRLYSNNKVMVTHNGNFQFHLGVGYNGAGSDYRDTIYEGTRDTILLTITRIDDEDEVLDILVNGNTLFQLQSGQGETSRTVKLHRVNIIEIKTIIDAHHTSTVEGKYTISVLF